MTILFPSADRPFFYILIQSSGCKPYALNFAVFAQHIEKLFHIIRQGRFELHYFVGRGMFKFKRMGVKRNTIYNRVLNGGLAIFQLPGIN
jgi:hypothetical protein